MVALLMFPHRRSTSREALTWSSESPRVLCTWSMIDFPPGWTAHVATSDRDSPPAASAGPTSSRMFEPMSFGT